jgi:hypothetical protein
VGRLETIPQGESQAVETKHGEIPLRHSEVTYLIELRECREDHRREILGWGVQPDLEKFLVDRPVLG